MKSTIKNNSRAPQGVHTTSGLLFIEPGASRTLDVAEGYVERVKKLPFLEVEWHDESPSEPKTPQAKAAAPDTERDDLKKQADELGLDYTKNIKTEKLRELIDAKLAE